MIKFKNAATTTISQTVNNSQTSITVADASVFPVLNNQDYFFIVAYSSTGNSFEIMKVTTVSSVPSNSLAVVRGQDGTTPLTFSSGDRIISRVTAGGLNDIVRNTFDVKVDLGSGTVIDLSFGSYFSKTISQNTAFTVINPNPSPFLTVFILDLVNSASHSIIYPNGTVWGGGTPNVLTPNGRDILTFFSYDSGLSWVGTVTEKDVR